MPQCHISREEGGRYRTREGVGRSLAGKGVSGLAVDCSPPDPSPKE